MKKFPTGWILMIYLFAVTRPCLGSDTTSIHIYQLNHYYTIDGFSHLNVNTNHFLIKANYKNKSNIFAKPGEPNRVKQENVFDTNFLYHVNPLFFVGPSFHDYRLSDEQHSSENNYTNSRVGFTGQLDKKLSFIGNGGFFWEKRRGIQDEGWYTSFELFNKEPYQIITPYLRLNYDKTPYRDNYTTDNSLKIKTPFFDDIFNTLTLNFKETRREYYINPNALSQTEVRTTRNQQLQDQFSYVFPFDIRFVYNLRFAAIRDNLNFYLSDSSATRERNTYQFTNQFYVSKNMEHLHIKGGYTSDQNQDQSSANRDEIQLPADYKYVRQTINTEAAYFLNPTDSLSLRYQVSVFHYDTPDTNNTDDRDEISYVLNPQLNFQLSPYIRWNVSGQMYLHHLIYLSSRRSGQNHWNRVYSISSHLNLSIPARLNWSSTQSLSTNYFVYDYEDSAFVNVNSNIFRSLYLDQHIEYFFSSPWGISLRVSGRLEDDGLLDWQHFIQDKATERYQVNQEYLISYRKQNFNVFAGPVFSKRWFYQKSANDQWTLIHYIYRRGITGGCRIKNLFHFKYTFEAIQQTGQKKVYNQNGALQLNIIL